MIPDLRTIARVLGGEVRGKQVVAPGPGHSRNDRSLAVTIGQAGKLIVCSFAGDDWQQCRDYVRERLGMRGPEIAPVRLIPSRERPSNVTRAAAIWHASIDIRGTLAERYLRGQGLDIPQDCVSFASTNPALSGKNASRRLSR